MRLDVIYGLCFSINYSRRYIKKKFVFFFFFGFQIKFSFKQTKKNVNVNKKGTEEEALTGIKIIYSEIEEWPQPKPQYMLIGARQNCVGSASSDFLSIPQLDHSSQNWTDFI